MRRKRELERKGGERERFRENMKGEKEEKTQQ